MAILWPAFALFALTAIVMLRLARLRFAAVAGGRVDPRFYKIFRGDGEPEEDRADAADGAGNDAIPPHVDGDDAALRRSDERRSARDGDATEREVWAAAVRRNGAQLLDLIDGITLEAAIPGAVATKDAPLKVAAKLVVYGSAA